MIKITKMAIRILPQLLAIALVFSCFSVVRTLAQTAPTVNLPKNPDIYIFDQGTPNTSTTNTNNSVTISSQTPQPTATPASILTTIPNPNRDPASVATVTTLQVNSASPSVNSSSNSSSTALPQSQQAQVIPLAASATASVQPPSTIIRSGGFSIGLSLGLLVVAVGSYFVYRKYFDLKKGLKMTERKLV